MTDLELLEAAAYAGGVIVYPWPTEDPVRLNLMGGIEWNPLTDDGTAFRLAASLNMSVSFGPIEVVANTISGALRRAFFRESRIHMDPCAATRRVIVLAAAEVGRAA